MSCGSTAVDAPPAPARREGGVGTAGAIPMQWNVSVGLGLFVCSIAASTAAAQSLTSTDVGSVGAAGSAMQSGGTWTVQGSGADIWGTSDSFQFAQQPAAGTGHIIA